MQPHTKLSVTATILLALSACSTTPHITQVGPDTWVAETGQSWHGREAAGQYCAQMGKYVLVTNMQQRFDGATVIFRCLNRNDPAYQRPDYQKPPTTVIQDNRQR
jgi:hypothetical protein